MEDLNTLARNFGFGPRGKSNSTRLNSNTTIDLDYASIFSSSARKISGTKTLSIPVHGKPEYGDGLRSKGGASKVSCDEQSTGFDDLLGNLRRKDKYDFSPGFGSGISSSNYRTVPESNKVSTPVGGPKHKSVADESFVPLDSILSHQSLSSVIFTNPQEGISSLGKSRGTRVEVSSGGGRGFDEVNHLNGLRKPVHSFYRADERGKGGSPSRSAKPQSAISGEQMANSLFRYCRSNSEKKLTVDNYQEPPLFDMPNISTGFQKPFGPTISAQYLETSPRVDMSPAKSGHQFDDVWLTVSDIPLKTHPSADPPPSRPPPPTPRRYTRSESGHFSSSSRNKGDGFSTHSNYKQHSCSPKLACPHTKDHPASQFDAREDSRSRNRNHDSAHLYSGEEMDAVSAASASADAMKDAMEKAEAKFKHARVVRVKEYAKAAKIKEYVQIERDDDHDRHEREVRETKERLERDKNHKEEEERHQKRLQRDMERSREVTREKARQAVERASRESHERSASEARLRNERAAVFKANSEARERAGRVAVQRVQSEARERAAAEAKVREEMAAAEGREKELRDKSAKAKAEDIRRRAERAAAEAREGVATGSVEMNQQRNDDDLESIFSREPKERANSSDPFYDQQFQKKGISEAAKRTSSVRESSSGGASSNVKGSSSTTNIVHDLSSNFGAAPSVIELREVEGETEERRKARLDRHQRTQERTANALAEKNRRDLQAQTEQDERHRIGETLDIEIKRWAAGKEGNLRALLSTLQYVLWPECGWQPVSLTDIIIGSSVKKVYRKATLCIHPDKVQQKGATLQQKYIAEKVFDLLKEAWNKFNSEELF